MSNAHALIAGIANYEHINRLPPTVLKDAQDIYNLLIDPEHCGYLPENVKVVLDRQATQAALRTALSDLASSSNKDSVVLLYFSGHGGRIESGPLKGEYLLPVDVVYSSFQSLAETAISGTEFTGVLQSISARKLVVVFDCCHAGGIGQPKDPAAATLLKAGLPESYYEKLVAGTGRVILASSRSSESSWVLTGAHNSLFTQHLLAGLRGGIHSEDGLIRIFNVFEYIQPRVTADEPQQHPIFKAEVEQNFPVALYLGGKKIPASKDEQGFRYDAYVSYVDRKPDSVWVWGKLIPHLKAAGVRIAVSEDIEVPGVERVINIQRGVAQAKRTVVVLSDAYLADNWATFENVLGQTMGIEEGSYRLLPIKIAPIERKDLPAHLAMLSMLDFTRSSQRTSHEFNRLVTALRGSLPYR